MQHIDSDIPLHYAQKLQRVYSWVLSCFVVAAIGCSGNTLLVPERGFSAQHGAQHPLLGQVYRGHELVSREVLLTALGGARFAVIGETHDNPDHHQLQAQLVQHFLAAQPGAAVAFEMLDEDDAASVTSPLSSEELAQRVDWANSGWPAFSMYKPVFDAALRVHAPIVAAHPSAAHVHASMQGLDEVEARELRIDTPLPEAQVQAQHDEIRESHCGHANDKMLTAMQRAQVYKDAFMARALTRTQTPAVLIAGRGHARNDRAVPYFLARARAGNTLSIALIEVADEKQDAAAYETEAFDYVVFTPRASNEDPCEKFRQQLEQMRQQPRGA